MHAAPGIALVSIALFGRAAMLRLLVGLVVGLPVPIVRQRIVSLPLSSQIPLIGTMLIGLALATVVFAEAGWGGPVAFWVTLALVVR